ncbi:hypothetical protein FHU37_002240 [Allostreptomyces psammosilenae]|uniref:DUF2867 domain-containing protein n=1 Tax=Allostreptomyces psammosilenae TaxID=1892865 RepID=A0A852ZUP0_9ACTN|nr:DUF2867 domain-containing protein [Allostreptomyces psammosilenae]NYI05297.1 hypothetical protein [Allostreptomyces psammosilenae]
MVRLAKSAYTEHPWRIHALAPDFRVEDVWAFRTPGAGPDDFPTMLAAMRAAGGFARQGRAARFLFAVRWKLGALLGWDDPTAGVGARVPSLRDRLPGDLRDADRGPDSDEMPLKAVYETATESARELANRTVHTVMHLGWAPAADGDHELRMAVLVKPNGWFGRLYMAAIAPFRHLVVYPALARQWELAWRQRDDLAARQTERPTEQRTGLPVGQRPVRGSVRALLRWASGIMLVLGAGHLLLVGLLLRQDFARWVEGGPWAAVPLALSDVGAGAAVESVRDQVAFWSGPGSFSVPLVLLGCLTWHLAGRGVAVPAAIGWGLAAWCFVGGVLLVPSPYFVGVIPGVLIVLAARKAAGSGGGRSGADAGADAAWAGDV